MDMMMDNYEVSKLRAQQYFLNFDQEKIIDDLKLKYDDAYLYTEFINTPYRICRRTGTVEKSTDDFITYTQAGYEEVLSIFDFFCHKSDSKVLSGKWAAINSLKGRPQSIGVGTDFYRKISQIFDEDGDAFAKACEMIGGVPVSYGDIGYHIPIFGDFSVIIKFYYSDDEFPAQTTILWDQNTLDFIYYETAFYVAGFLLNTIAEAMENER